VLLPFEGVAGFAELARELLTLSRGLHHLQRLLVSARACGFIAVVRPERLPAAETLRLIEWLRRHKIARRGLIVNGVTAGACARCRRAADRERREIRTMYRQYGWKGVEGPVVEAPAIAPPPSGFRELARWAATWRLPTRRSP
jgi:anion-transporting  ArsA/GET3 family ATPase